jgi:hypothetical protein
MARATSGRCAAAAWLHDITLLLLLLLSCVLFPVHKSEDWLSGSLQFFPASSSYSCVFQFADVVMLRCCRLFVCCPCRGVFWDRKNSRWRAQVMLEPAASICTLAHMSDLVMHNLTPLQQQLQPIRPMSSSTCL